MITILIYFLAVNVVTLKPDGASRSRKSKFSMMSSFMSMGQIFSMKGNLYAYINNV